MDTDDSDGSSSDCANAIRHALIKIFGRDNVDFILQCQMTDSGGGGTGLSFHRTLQNQGITTNDANYLVGYCTLHCIQLTLSTPVKHVLGEDGTDNSGQYRQNAMQLLHGIYNLQKHHEREEWKIIWRKAEILLDSPAIDNGSMTVPCPILTRWWTVGVAAEFAIKNWQTILCICKGVIKRDLTTKASNKIASATEALLKTQQIKSDVHLLSAYHTYFLFNHFKWLQLGDQKIGGGKAGYLNRHIAVRYLPMHEDLNDAIQNDKWKTLPEFSAFCETNGNLSFEDCNIQEKKVTLVFTLALKLLRKHFDVWVNKLLFLSLYSEQPTASCIANYISSGDHNISNPIQESYNSSIHGRVVNLNRFQRFVSTRCTSKITITSSVHVAPYLAAISKIKTGGDMWIGVPSPVLVSFRNHYLHNYVALPSNSHLAESSVKDANFCSIIGRSEKTSSMFATSRSGLVETLNMKANKARSSRIQKGNASVSSGLMGSRKRKSDGADFVEQGYRHRTSGSTRSTIAREIICKRHTDIESSLTNPRNKQMWKRIHSSIGDNVNQFRTSRVATKIETYDRNITKEKLPNALQRRTGVEVSPLVLGRTWYTSIRKDQNLFRVEQDLVHRGLATDGGWMKDLITRLKSYENNKETFKPQCPDVNFDDIYLL